MMFSFTAFIAAVVHPLGYIKQHMTLVTLSFVIVPLYCLASLVYLLYCSSLVLAVRVSVKSSWGDRGHDTNSKLRQVRSER